MKRWHDDGQDKIWEIRKKNATADETSIIEEEKAVEETKGCIQPDTEPTKQTGDKNGDNDRDVEETKDGNLSLSTRRESSRSKVDNKGNKSIMRKCCWVSTSERYSQVRISGQLIQTEEAQMSA